MLECLNVNIIEAIQKVTGVDLSNMRVPVQYDLKSIVDMEYYHDDYKNLPNMPFNTFYEAEAEACHEINYNLIYYHDVL